MRETKFKGETVRLAGDFPKVGEKAPHFMLSKGDLTPYCLKDGKGKFIVMNIFPSLDTEVCAMTVRRFNELAAKFPETEVLAISRDLPFAQKRFCTAEGISHVTALSDFHIHSTFGRDYGVWMLDGPLNGLFARAIVVVNPKGMVVHAQLIPEITQEPDYEAALEAVKEVKN